MPIYRTPILDDLNRATFSHRTPSGSTFRPAAAVLVVDPIAPGGSNRIAGQSVRSTYAKALAEAEAISARPENAGRIVVVAPMYVNGSETGWVDSYTPDVCALAVTRSVAARALVVDRFVGPDVVRVLAERDARLADEERERNERERAARAEREERERRELAEREARERAAREVAAARSLRAWRGFGADCAFCAARVDGANVGVLDGRPACASCVEEIAEDRRRSAAGLAATLPGGAAS